MEALENEARGRDMSPKKMLDKIIDDWFDGVYPAPHKEAKERPWYLK